MAASGRPADPTFRFPPTHLSVLERARSSDPEIRSRGHEALAAIYWAPLYAHSRLRHRLEREDAEDLVQGFFAEALRRDLFARHDPTRARFRTFLRTCLDSYAANEGKARRRLKRGGGAAAIPLDVAELEGRLASEPDADRLFDREWVRAVLTRAVARLRERCLTNQRAVHFVLFERYDLASAGGGEPPTYAALAHELGLSPSQVTNWLAAARREFRAAVLETLREICATDDEFRDEARALLGVEIG